MLTKFLRLVFRFPFHSGLSSMGQSQASHSLQSITDPHAPAVSGERKISFVLQDNESNESGEKAHVSKSPEVHRTIETFAVFFRYFTFVLVLFQAEGEQADDKKARTKVRPLLLRRGTPAGSSFRRRSIKLQRGKKDQDSECKTE